MIGIRWVGSVALLIGLAVSDAGASAPDCEEVRRFTLKNGLEVLLLSDARLPSVALVASIHAGARHDPPGYEGLAHYVEHLTFRAAPPFASAFDLYAEAGAIEVNAATTPDTTDYFAVLPAGQLERGLWIEARRLAIGLDRLEPRAAREEREVLLREHELRYGWQPGFRQLEAALAALFPEPHPYHSLLATEGSLEPLELDDARWFFGEHYRPDNARLVLVGDVRPDEARRWIEEYFAPLGPSPAAAKRPEPALACARWAPLMPAPAQRRIVLASRSRNERLELFWPLLPGEDPEHWRAVFRLLESELGRALRQAGLGRGARAVLARQELGSFWRLAIDVAPGAPIDHIVPLLEQSLASLRSSFDDPTARAAQREAIELWQALDVSLLGRARNLARRACSPSSCSDAKPALLPWAQNPLDRFDPGRALVVERRFRADAPDAGELWESR